MVFPCVSPSSFILLCRLWDLLVKQNYQSVGGTDHWPKDVSITDNEEIEDSRPDGSKDIDKSAPALDDDSVVRITLTASFLLDGNAKIDWK